MNENTQKISDSVENKKMNNKIYVYYDNEGRKTVFAKIENSQIKAVLEVELQTDSRSIISSLLEFQKDHELMFIEKEELKEIYENTWAIAINACGEPFAFDIKNYDAVLESLHFAAPMIIEGDLCMGDAIAMVKAMQNDEER